MIKSKIHKIESETIKAHQRGARIQIAVENADIPLKENWGERWCTMPEDYELFYEKVLKFQLREDDVFVVTFFKCGTTWMQELAWLLMNNLNYERAKSELIVKRSIFLEISGLNKGNDFDNVEICNNAPSPRLIKTHLPANLLPQEIWRKKQKTIYVARNAKDVIVSAYHFCHDMGNYLGTIADFAEDFMKDEIMWTPFWAHLIDFYKMRNEPFIFFTTYEEMQKDLAGVIRRLCTFLERAELNEDELKQLVEHLSFKNMKANEQTNYTSHIKNVYMKNTEVKEHFNFMRRGIVGSYKDDLSPEILSKFDAWSDEILAKHGFKQSDIFGDV